MELKILKNIEKMEDNWDWDGWKKHFEQIDDQDRLLSVLKSQLKRAIKREDYEDAARLKVAIAAAATNDAVGKVMSNFYRAVLEECYKDAVYLRDKAGSGLVGWWSVWFLCIKTPNLVHLLLVLLFLKSFSDLMEKGTTNFRFFFSLILRSYCPIGVFIGESCSGLFDELGGLL